MATIDIIILIALLPSLYFGFKNGLVKQIISFAVIYLGITLSLKFADSVSPYVLQYIKVNDFWAKAISFIIIFAAVSLVLSLLGNIIHKALGTSAAGFLNRILGVLLSLIISTLLVSLVVYFVDSFNQLTEFIPKEKIADSQLYNFMLEVAKSFFPHLKSLF